MRDKRSDTKITLTESANAAIVSSGTSAERGPNNEPLSSHPAFTSHPIQGWTPDFIPYVLQETLDKGFYDEMVLVSGPDGIACSRRLAAEAGIFTGIPAGRPLPCRWKWPRQRLRAQ